MLFAFYCLDGPNAPAMRAQWIDQHKAYIAEVAGQIAFAGPLLYAPEGDAKGSLLVLDFPDLSAARDWIAIEPFNRAGVYANIQVEHFANYWAQKTGFPPTT